MMGAAPTPTRVPRAPATHRRPPYAPCFTEPRSPFLARRSRAQRPVQARDPDLPGFVPVARAAGHLLPHRALEHNKRPRRDRPRVLRRPAGARALSPPHSSTNSHPPSHVSAAASSLLTTQHDSSHPTTAALIVPPTQVFPLELQPQAVISDSLSLVDRRQAIERVAATATSGATGLTHLVRAGAPGFPGQRARAATASDSLRPLSSPRRRRVGGLSTGLALHLLASSPPTLPRRLARPFFFLLAPRSSPTGSATSRARRRTSTRPSSGRTPRIPSCPRSRGA